MKRFVSSLVLLLLVSGIAFGQTRPTLDIATALFVTAEQDPSDGSLTIVTQARDPQIRALFPAGKNIPQNETMLSFEYQSDKPISDFQMFFAPELNERRSVTIPELKATPSGQWGKFTYFLRDVRERLNWGNDAGNWFIRLDWGNVPDVTIRIRNVEIRQPSNQEKVEIANNDADLHFKQMLGDKVFSYLNTSYPCRITSVDVSEKHITVTGTTDGRPHLALAEVMPYENITELQKFCYTKSLSGNTFNIRINRYEKRDGFRYDRLLSKWVIVDMGGKFPVIASHAKHPTGISPRNTVPSHKPFNKKGMLGIASWPGPEGIVDLDTMNAATIGIGITLNSMFHLTPSSPKDVAFTYGGETYYADGDVLARTDEMVEAYNRHDCHVLCYVRNYPANEDWTDSVSSRVLIHPQCNGGYQCAMNIANAEGLNAVAACLDFIGRRYSTPGRRIHIWATQNEVNANRSWCNLGDNNPEVYFSDYYTRMMRVMHDIFHQYDQNTAVLAVFEHNWAQSQASMSSYPARNVLDFILLSSAAEGDFYWGMGAHPYPLHHPDFWAKDVPPEITPSDDSPKVTFKNLEVINRWILNPKHFYKGNIKRPLYLCENGISSTEFTPQCLTLQAAATAWAWKKASAMDGVDSFMWYSPNDYSGDFGLNLGLRFAGSYKDNPGGRKPSWFVWQAAGSDREDEVFAPYLEVIGITSWDQIFE